jgi:hypothetical protein
MQAQAGWLTAGRRQHTRQRNGFTGFSHQIEQRQGHNLRPEPHVTQHNLRMTVVIKVKQALNTSRRIRRSLFGAHVVAQLEDAMA